MCNDSNAEGAKKSVGNLSLSGPTSSKLCMHSKSYLSIRYSFRPFQLNSLGVRDYHSLIDSFLLTHFNVFFCSPSVPPGTSPASSTHRPNTWCSITAWANTQKGPGRSPSWRSSRSSGNCLRLTRSSCRTKATIRRAPTKQSWTITTTSGRANSLLSSPARIRSFQGIRRSRGGFTNSSNLSIQHQVRKQPPQPPPIAEYPPGLFQSFSDFHREVWEAYRRSVDELRAAQKSTTSVGGLSEPL